MDSTSKILVLSFSHLKSDPRVKRQIRFLADKVQVTCGGYSDPEITNAEYVDLNAKKSRIVFLLRLWLLAFRCYELYYWTLPEIKKTLQQLSGRTFDIIIANDVDMLPVALKLAGKNTKVIFDAHEYAPL